MSLIISGVIDGPLAGGVPKAIELFANEDIADLSIYGVGSANNGNGGGVQEFTLSGSANAGDYIYIASETDGFTNFFGFAPTFTNSAANINGDDAIELFENGTVIDVFGDVNVDGTGQPWEHTDGWAYRVDGTGPSTVFNESDWTFSTPDALDNETSNSTAASPFPVGTFAFDNGNGATIDLSDYVRIGRYNLPVPTRTTAPAGSQLALEASTVTYNPLTGRDTLFVLGDEGTSVVQISKTGQLIDSMTLVAGNFDDPEGLTYVSGIQFALVEERQRQVNLFNYVPGGTLSRADVLPVKLGTTVGNIGLEGISFDPQTGEFILVKETSPQGIFQTDIDFASGRATNGSPTTENSTNLFDPALMGLTDIADVFALSNLPGSLTDDNLLVLSQEDGVIVNVDRNGNITSSLAIAADPENPLTVAGQGHEGVTMDNDGLLYIVNEQGGGDSDHPQLWVYAPADFVYANAAPVEISLSNTTPTLAENSDTSAPIQVGTIVISDDALGTNILSLGGTDADSFEINGLGLFLKAETVLDFETKDSFEVTVIVDDPTVGGTPDAVTTFTLAIADTTDTPAALIVSEVAPWSSGNSPGVGADWFEVTNTSDMAVDITGWRFDDNSSDPASGSALSGVTSIDPGQSVVFVDGDANTINAFVNTWFGGTLPSGIVIGTYDGPGLGTGGDAVNLFDASGTLVTGVTFGASPSASPFASFDNAAGLPSVSTLSTAGVNGAFSVIDVGANEAAVLIGSPGTISVAPVPVADLVAIAATDATAAEEGQNPGTFTILRTGDTTADLEVMLTLGGDADPTDYTPSLPTTVTIPAGASATTITITPEDDALAEPTESVTLTLVDTAAYDVAANATSATVTIEDNDTAIANFDLQITEMWPGNSEGDDLTADWFEITNIGTEAWVSGVAPDLYYDDDSQDPTVADLISGLEQIDPGESVVVVIGNDADAQTLTSIWGSVIDLTGVDVGFTDGSGLGAGGDGVSLFVGLPGTGAVPADFETYPDTDGFAGQSYDVDRAAFSVAGENGAVATAPNDANESAVGSPGNGTPIVTEEKTVFINEVLVSTTSTDVEFIEIFGEPGTSLAGLSVLNIEGGMGAGSIDNRFDLPDDAVIGENGFYLIGNNLVAGALGVTPNVEIPGNFFENSSSTIAVVETATITGTSVSGNETVIDAVALQDSDGGTFFYGAPVLGPDGSFYPSAVTRTPDGGDFELIDAFSPAGANTTPTAGTVAAQPLVINEVLGNTTGTDVEYIELFGEAGTSLDGLSIIVVEGDAGSPIGSIDARVDLGSEDVVGDNGFFLIGNSLVNSTYGVTPNQEIALNFIENSSYTIALVETSSLAGSTVSGSEVVLDTVGVTDGGAGDTFFFDAPVVGPDGTFLPAGVRRVTDGVDTDTVNDWVLADFNLGSENTPTAGTGDNGGGGNGEPVLISAVQGDGTASPLVGSTVTIEAVVVGDFQDGASGTNGDFNGFFVQEEDTDADGNDATSEGLFIFDGNSPAVDVEVGDLVRVTGTVSEFFGETQLSGVTVEVINSDDNSSLVTPATITFPVANTVTNSDGGLIADLEAYEGMLVTIPQELTVADLFTLGRFGDIGLHADGRLETYTQANPPSVSGFQAFQDLGVRNTVILDDGSTIQNPATIPFEIPSDPGNVAGQWDANDALSVGDTVTNLTGVVRFSRGSGGSGDEIYRINPVDTVDFVNTNPRPTEAPAVEGSIKVASFNVLNFFTSLGDEGLTSGPAGLDPRGADNQVEFDRQLDKLVAALAEINADVFGLVELENEFGDQNGDGQFAIGFLADALNAAIPGANYQFVDPGTGYVGSDAIAVGFIYNANTVKIADGTTVAVLTDSDLAALGVDPGNPVFEGAGTSRSPIAATFEEIATGETFTATVNHFKSKGSISPFGDNAGIGDGTGNNNEARLQAAIALDAWLKTDPTGSGDPDVLILGDLNAYGMEDPIQYLLNNGYEDQVKRFLETGDFEYSFGFPLDLDTSPQVQAFGALDYALATGSLAAQITGAAEWHINADEASALDYNTNFKPQEQIDGLFGADPFRSSDHDPVIVGLNLASDPEPATFTLELLHIADQEAAVAAIQDAPRLSAVLNALRDQDLGNDGLADNTLTLSSGDAFIPGLFFNASAPVFGSAGIADIQIQNELGMQAIAFGNHEFDFGTGVLAGLISGSAPGTILGADFAGADFPYLSTNLNVAPNTDLAPLEVPGGQAPQAGTVTSSVIIDVNGEDIGVVGATTPTLASISSPGTVGVAPTPFATNPTPEQLDALAAEIQAEVDALLAANPGLNKVVLLSHMQQLNIERELAARLVNVDIIVGGGSNTRLFDENDRVRAGDSIQGQYPEFITNGGGTQTALVNTDGSYKYVGRLVLDFDADGNIIPESYDPNVSGAYATDDQGVADLNAQGLVDPEIQQIVDAIEAQILATESNVFGISNVFLNGNRSGTTDPTNPDGVRTQETNLGNLTADANLAEAQAIDPTVVVSIKNGGGIRASIGRTVVPAGGTEFVRLPNEAVVDSQGNVIKPEGGISQNDIQTALAFNNGLSLLTLTKTELVALLEHGVGNIGAGSFPQIAGVKLSYDPDFAVGDRILNAGIFDENDTLIAELVRDGEIVGDANQLFRIVALDFLATPRFDVNGNYTGGGDGYPFPNLNTDPALGEVGDPAVIERVNLVSLVETGTPTGDATFANDGTEQDALAEYLFDNFLTTPFGEADAGRNLDERIQNLNFREDTVLGDVVVPDTDLEIGLFDADTDQLIEILEGGDQILVSAIANRSVTIAAFVPNDSPFAGQVGSMSLDLNNGEVFQVENRAPYGLFGDNRGDFDGGFLPLGENSITFDVFSGRRLSGDLLGSVTRDFAIVDDIETPGDAELFVGLYDADTDTLIGTLEDGDQLLASDLAGRNVAIAALVPESSAFFGDVESVFLNLNEGQVTKTENTEPYALFGDTRGDFRSGILPAGSNNLMFELYSENRLRGNLLQRVELNFTVVNDVA